MAENDRIAADGGLVNKSSAAASSPADSHSHPSPSHTSHSDEDHGSATASGGSANGATAPEVEEKKATKPPKKGLLARLGIEPFIILMCLKGAVAPTIALAMFQADAVASTFVTIGYVVGIISILAMPIMPRGKFLSSLLLNLIFVCLGAAVGLLALWSSFQARAHTQTRPSGYNSSQSAVSAIWLISCIWVSNLMRAKMPSLNIPVIVFTIMVNISATYSPTMTSVPMLEGFMKQLLTAFLTAFGLAFGVSLLIIPFSSRMVVGKQMTGLIMLLRGTVKQEKAYIESLEKEDMFAVPVFLSAGTGLEDGKRKSKHKKSKKEVAAEKKKKSAPNSQAEGEAVKATLLKTKELMGKIGADLPFAQREIGWGKLNGKHFKHIAGLLRDVVIATGGIGTIIDIFQRIAEKRGWMTDSNTDFELLKEKMDEKRVWNHVMRQLHEPFQTLSEAVDQGLEHAGITLELLPKPKKAGKGKNKENGDVEGKGDLVKPGDPEFSNILKTKLKTLHTVRKQILHAWAKENGLYYDAEDVAIFSENEKKHQHERQQLFVLLYIESLMQAAGVAVLKLVQYADNRVEDGTMAKSHLIIPKAKRLKQWFTSMFDRSDRAQDQEGDLFESANAVVYTGSAYSKKDPEHKKPANGWQRAGNVVRTISRIISSPESGFGLRVACATMTIGIVAFLEDTHIFFQQQRLVWAMIMVALAMTQSAGQSIFGFICRTGGTVCAMVFSIINWYIVDGKTPGVLVFLFLFLAFEFFFFFKYPAFLQGSIICVVTHTLIIGYELQTEKLGLAVAERTGQPYYPIYELAPYRLATVAGGCFVAFIWTIFPSPVTDRTWLRHDLANTLFLLAKYFGVIKEKMNVNLDCEAEDGAAGVKGGLLSTLTRHQRSLSSKLLILLPSLRQHAEFQRWEPTIGGAFPRQTYEDIILRAMRINSYITLIEHTIDSPSTHGDSNGSGLSGSWTRAIRRLVGSANTTTDNIICILVLLANALDSGHPLPPNLPLPKAYGLTRLLEEMRDAQGNRKGLELLNAKHMTEAGYAEFAVLQVCSTLICDDLAGLEKDISDLVGTVDFSFQVSNKSTSSSILTRESTTDGEGSSTAVSHGNTTSASDGDDGGGDESSIAPDGGWISRRTTTMMSTTAGNTSGGNKMGSRVGTGISRRKTGKVDDEEESGSAESSGNSRTNFAGTTTSSANEKGEIIGKEGKSE